jgi:PREDICTED: similar to CEGP1 protein
VYDKENDVQQMIVNKVEEWSKSNLILFGEMLNAPSNKIICSSMFTRPVNCLVQLIIKYPLEVKNNCDKQCHINFLETLIKSDVQKLIRAMKASSQIKFNVTELSVDYFIECESGFEVFHDRCGRSRNQLISFLHIIPFFIYLHTLVSCNPGFYRKQSYNKCLPCSQNTYQPSFGQSACIDCPKGTYTIRDTQGSTSIKQCLLHGFISNYQFANNDSVDYCPSFFCNQIIDTLMEEGKEVLSSLSNVWQTFESHFLR